MTTGTTLTRQIRPAAQSTLLPDTKRDLDRASNRALHEAHRWDGPKVGEHLQFGVATGALVYFLFIWNPAFLHTGGFIAVLLYGAGIYGVRRVWAMRHHRHSTDATQWSRMAYQHPVDTDRFAVAAIALAASLMFGATIVTATSVVVSALVTALIVQAVWVKAVSPRPQASAAVPAR